MRSSFQSWHFGLVVFLLLGGVTVMQKAIPDTAGRDRPSSPTAMRSILPPQDVRDAVARLQTVCAGWVQPPIKPRFPSEPTVFVPEAGMCQMVNHPDRTSKRLTVFGASFEMLLTIAGLIAFAVLRPLALMAWRMRPMQQSRARTS